MDFSGHSFATAVLPILLNGLIGFVAGLLVVGAWTVIEKVRGN
jgi:predicted DNA repair protein MutK